MAWSGYARSTVGGVFWEEIVTSGTALETVSGVLDSSIPSSILTGV